VAELATVLAFSVFIGSLATSATVLKLLLMTNDQRGVTIRGDFHRAVKAEGRRQPLGIRTGYAARQGTRLRNTTMPALTQHTIFDQLRALGLTAGDSVMMHSSLSALGPVDGGPDAVVDGIHAAIGPSGTLMVPSFRDSVWGDPDDFTNSDCDCQSQDGLCPSQQPGFQGILTETVRSRAGSLRSCHKTHSWVALGPVAGQLLATHRQTPAMCGEGNPFEPLLELDGKLLLLGVQVNTVTLWHYYEEILRVPYVGHFWPDERHLNHCVPGRRIQYQYPGIMQEVCRAAGILRTGPVGKSTSGVMRARDFESFMATIMRDDPYCLVLRPPDRHHGDLAVDALQKAARMLTAWQRGATGPPEAFDTPWRRYHAAGPDEVVRTDCPTFAGFHPADGTQVPLCHANDRHPDYFSRGGVFNECGITACDQCWWHRTFPTEGT